MRLLRPAGALLFAATRAALGCILVTGGTDGYTLAPPEAGICATEAGLLGVDLSCQCASSADCPSDGGKQYCCLSLDLAKLSAASSCEVDPCHGSLTVQLCTQSSECAGAGCYLQSCSFDGSVPATVTVQACGEIPGCSR